ADGYCRVQSALGGHRGGDGAAGDLYHPSAGDLHGWRRAWAVAHRTGSHQWRARFQHAGADRTCAALCVPRYQCDTHILLVFRVDLAERSTESMDSVVVNLDGRVQIRMERRRAV